MKSLVQFFMVFALVIESPFAVAGPMREKDLQNLNASLIDFNIHLTAEKYRQVKTPNDIAKVFLSQLSETEYKAAENALAKLNTLPSMTREGNILILRAAGDVAKIEIVDLIGKKFKINGKSFVLDTTLPFNEQVRFVDERIKPNQSTSLLLMMIEPAYAWTQVLAIVATALLTAAATSASGSGSNIMTLMWCRAKSISGGACANVEDPKFDNFCISKDGKKLNYTTNEEPYTALTGTIEGGKLVQLTQVFLSKPEGKKSSTEDEQLIGLPIIYNIKDGQIESVELPGTTLDKEKLFKTIEGKPNPAGYAYSQMLSFAKAMVNYCTASAGKDGKQKKEWDKLVVPVAKTISKINQASGTTDAAQAITIESVDPSALKTTIQSQKNAVKESKPAMKKEATSSGAK